MSAVLVAPSASKSPMTRTRPPRWRSSSSTAAGDALQGAHRQQRARARCPAPAPSARRARRRRARAPGAARGRGACQAHSHGARSAGSREPLQARTRAPPELEGAPAAQLSAWSLAMSATRSRCPRRSARSAGERKRASSARSACRKADAMLIVTISHRECQHRAGAALRKRATSGGSALAGAALKMPQAAQAGVRAKGAPLRRASPRRSSAASRRAPRPQRADGQLTAPARAGFRVPVQPHLDLRAQAAHGGRLRSARQGRSTSPPAQRAGSVVATAPMPARAAGTPPDARGAGVSPEAPNSVAKLAASAARCASPRRSRPR